MAGACGAGACLRAAGASPPGSAGAHGLAAGALASWLAAELLGLYMLRNWIASGGLRDRLSRPRGLSPALIFGHAGLALTGLASWVGFVFTGAPALAWTGVGFLAPAIGLGISTVTVWTPYPVQRGPAGETSGASAGQAAKPAPAILVTNETLDRALQNEALASKLVDDLLERMLAVPPPPPARDRGWQFAPVIPILHGVLAITTFLLAMLAAVVALAT